MLCGDAQINVYFDPMPADGSESEEFIVSGSKGYKSTKRRTTLQVEISIILNEGTIIFESEPQDSSPDLWYESSESYPINELFWCVYCLARIAGILTPRFPSIVLSPHVLTGCR